MKNLQIPIYKMIVDEEGLGLFGISFVDDPAIQTDFIAFRNDDKMKMYLVSKEKHEVVSPLMIPNQLIYRETPQGEPYYIKADKETIKKAAEKYLLSGNFNNFTYMHENIESDMSQRAKPNIFLKRIWIIENEQKDDANTKYGFSLPEGTLMVHVKVLNRDMWKRIKSGELRGLSLEGFFKMSKTNKGIEIEFNKMENTTIDYSEKELSLFNKFLAFMNSVQEEAENIESVASQDNTESGDVELKYWLDDEHYFTVDGEGYVRNDIMELVGAGEYKLADGNVISVDENSKFIETKAISEAEDAQPLETPIAEKKQDEKEEDDEEIEDVVDPEDEGTDGEDVLPDGEENGEDEPIEDEETTDAVSITIDDKEYLIPVEVKEYIDKLLVEKEELTAMSEVTPSSEPVVANISNVETGNDLSEGISRINAFKSLFGRK